MPLTLAQYRTQVSALLSDSGNIRYSTADIDAALTTALAEYTRLNPIIRTYVDYGNNTTEMILPTDIQGIGITSVEWMDIDPPLSLSFIAERIDEQWRIRFQELTPSETDMLCITYTDSHTIDNLNSAPGSTVPAHHDTHLCMGAAGYALATRANSRAETINLQPQVQAQLQAQAAIFIGRFAAAVTGAHAQAVARFAHDADGVF
jgi:hypothetical protein